MRESCAAIVFLTLPMHPPRSFAGQAGPAALAGLLRHPAIGGHALAFARIGTLLGAKAARWEPGLSAEGSIADADTSATQGTRTSPRVRLIYYRQQDLVQAK